MLPSSGKEFLAEMMRLHDLRRREPLPGGSNADAALERIGSSLRALYIVSTCANGCRGGDHTLERLCGRCFNLAYAAVELARIGLYDEALNEVRSLGELGNLVSLCVCDPRSFQLWMDADDSERIKSFKPAQIRKLIEKANGLLLIDAKTYGELCERVTHPTPRTQPNAHSDDERSRVGGFSQGSGLELVLTHLEPLLFCLSTAFSKFVGQDDLFEELAREVRADGASTAPT